MAQESFVKAFSHLESIRSPDAFGTWLLTLVSREAVKWLDITGTNVNASAVIGLKSFSPNLEIEGP